MRNKIEWIRNISQVHDSRNVTWNCGIFCPKQWEKREVGWISIGWQKAVVAMMMTWATATRSSPTCEDSIPELLLSLTFKLPRLENLTLNLSPKKSRDHRIWIEKKPSTWRAGNTLQQWVSFWQQIELINEVGQLSTYWTWNWLH